MLTNKSFYYVLHENFSSEIFSSFLSRESGALGSRLSGAGWGGCTVSLVPQAKLEAFLQDVKKGYYIGRPDREPKLNESLFATQPGSGAAILKLD